MRSGGNNFNYFPEDKLTKLTNFVQFLHMLMFCLEDWRGWARWPPLGYATVVYPFSGHQGPTKSAAVRPR